MDLSEVVLRKLIKEDLGLVYKWRNDPLIRHQMFNSGEISLEEHQKYWDQRLRKGNCYVIVLDGRDIGVVKLNKTDDGFEVDIFIDPSEQGKGIGTTALLKLKELAKKQGILKLVAKIKSDNAGSQRIFEKNGFKLKYSYYECDLR